MANISAIKLPDGITYTIVDNTSGWTNNKGTVTSVRVQASSPVQSSVSTAQDTSLNTTISLADGYGDTKNPYASKTKNYVLAAPSNANGAPSFRALVAADIPDLSGTYLTSYTETDPIFLASAAHGITASDITNWNNKTSNTGTVKTVTAGAGLNTTSNNTATDGGDITTTGTLYLTTSGVTAGSYGDNGNQTPNYGSTFKVPYITVDKYGRVTTITEHTVKIPASDNTNTTYNLSNALASHTFTETLTAGGSGSGTSTATITFAASTGIELTDDTTNKKITIKNTGVTSITTTAGMHSTKNNVAGAVSLSIPTHTSHLTNDSDYTTKAYVDEAITNLPKPMLFKGSVGTNGTVTWANLAAAATGNEGWTYKVITAHTAETGKPAAKVGDTIISTGSEWVVIPSGDEPSGTVTSVAATGATNSGISVTGTPITTSGTLTIDLNLSTAINGLSEGSSPATRDDYIVAQYAGGGTATTTYHRRKLSNIFAALNKSDITTALGYTPPTTDTNYYHTSGSWDGFTYTATPNGGAGALAFTIPTGSSATTVAVGNHTHGNITNGGDITAVAPDIANGDQIVINDHSASKITNGPTFDGSTKTKALTPAGTWETFLTSHQSLSGYVPTSRTIDGKALTGNIILHTSKTATLSTTWSSNQQTVSVTGVTASNTVIVTPAPASFNDYCACGIYCLSQAANSLTFKCDDVPSTDLTVNILIID